MIDMPGSSVAAGPLSHEQIDVRIKNCPRLPSLRSIDSALRELLNADQRYTNQISEVIRRDPSLTARLLRLVNSVYYGLSSPVNSIEEAVFYLGVRQIRQLAMVTPVIEDFQKLAGKSHFQWKAFWQHCIGTAILTREVIGSIHSPADEVDYVAGLVHDVGKIAMASAFPDHFERIYSGKEIITEDHELLLREEAILGMNHAELGALYLKNHALPEIFVETARYHHRPEMAARDAKIVAAVQIADLLVRFAGIGVSGNTMIVTEDHWLNASGWGILFPQQVDNEKNIARAHLKRSLERLPMILEGLV